MQEQFEAGVIIEAPVIDHNKGGLIVDCGIRGFVPISQIVDFPRRPQNDQPRDAAQEIAEKLQPFVGRKLRLKILEVNRKANRLILSEKVALYEERREKRDELFSSLQVGQKVTGTVRSIAPFGVFVDLGGIDGLVHKSELSWNKVNNPEAGYQVGEEVEAEVIDINHERGRISLSIRRLQPDPWHSTVADFKVGDIIDGTVTKLVNFGAFVRVRDGLEGLIHISELSHQRVAHPGDVVHEGQYAQAQDHRARLRAPSPRPQPQAGRGGARSTGAEHGARCPPSRRERPSGRSAASAAIAARERAATTAAERSRSPRAGSTTHSPRPSPSVRQQIAAPRPRMRRRRAEADRRGRGRRRRGRRAGGGATRRRPPRQPRQPPMPRTSPKRPPSRRRGRPPRRARRRGGAVADEVGSPRPRMLTRPSRTRPPPSPPSRRRRTGRPRTADEPKPRAPEAATGRRRRTGRGRGERGAEADVEAEPADSPTAEAETATRRRPTRPLSHPPARARRALAGEPARRPPRRGSRPGRGGQLAPRRPVGRRLARTARSRERTGPSRNWRDSQRRSHVSGDGRRSRPS